AMMVNTDIEILRKKLKNNKL
ncbi:aromatic acid exporter family protein, partial [Streptococcus agalactiae]|nr:aromatic acid exporter family protein [Streptococcus agalactiae]